MTMVTATPPAGISSAGAPDNRNVLLSVRDVQKVYGSREAVTRALDDVSFDICEGEFVGVMGPSGSGKSTLLNCISTIDTVTSGNIILNGLDITQLRSRQLSKFRRDDLGFIFQDANLLDTLTGFENIALALTIKGEKADAVRTKVDRTADLLGVADVLQKYPRQMSGDSVSALPRRAPSSPTRSWFWLTSPPARSIRATPLFFSKRLKC